MKYYKLLREIYVTSSYYHEGLNEDVVPLDEDPNILGSGLYFTDEHHIARHAFINGPFIADVTIPEGEKIIQVGGPETGVYRAHRIILSNIRHVHEVCPEAIV